MNEEYHRRLVNDDVRQSFLEAYREGEATEVFTRETLDHTVYSGLVRHQTNISGAQGTLYNEFPSVESMLDEQDFEIGDIVLAKITVGHNRINDAIGYVEKFDHGDVGVRFFDDEVEGHNFQEGGLRGDTGTGWWMDYEELEKLATSDAEELYYKGYITSDKIKLYKKKMEGRG